MSHNQIPLVDYLVLGEQPYLEANECQDCGAQFFDRRNSCARCFANGFRRVPIPSTGEVRAFTIVSMAAPGVPVPFASAIVDCGGTTVRGNLINIEPVPDQLHTGMKVQLATYSMGLDADGVEAIGYGFEPITAGPAGTHS